MLDGQGYDISCDLVMKVSVGVHARANQELLHTDQRDRQLVLVIGL